MTTGEFQAVAFIFKNCTQVDIYIKVQSKDAVATAGRRQDAG
jgi:hypothetical protein